jgi:hypothetical protein
MKGFCRGRGREVEEDEVKAAATRGRSPGVEGVGRVWKRVEGEEGSVER